MSIALPAPVGDHVIAERLARYGRFGVHLGLDRIRLLLQALGNPQERVPIIHVGGTNGKGSVCAYLSTVLAQAGYRVGRYTSPHLISWCERICLNNQPIAPSELEATLAQVESAIDPQTDSPTQFEVITAAAWLYFAQAEVDIAVIEVGLGGRLDATNVCDRPLVSIITSLSREHWQQLGPTLADIAREKAGILKPHCPAVIGPLPSEAQAVVAERIQALGCPATYPKAAQAMGLNRAQYDKLDLALPLHGKYQYSNVALAIAALRILQNQGWTLSDPDIIQGIAAARWPGRLQWLNWQPPDQAGQTLLIDGAHNPAAAQALRQYLDQLSKDQFSETPQPCSWVMGMLTTKDHRDVFEALLRPGDRLYLVPVPEHQSAPPDVLATIAQQVCPGLAQVQCYDTLESALNDAFKEKQTMRVLCGSLYLIGCFFEIYAGYLTPLGTSG